MGEKENKPFQLSFNGLLKVDFQGSRVTSDGGLILVRELDERLGLGKLIEEHLSDSRQGLNKKFPFADLLRQSVYSLATAGTAAQDQELVADELAAAADEDRWAAGQACPLLLAAAG